MAATLICRIVMDEPGETSYGPNDALRGSVRVTPQAGRKTTSTELFGPLKVVLRFSGRAKTKMKISRNDTTHTYRGRAPLFSKQFLIYDGTFREKFGEEHGFPFAVRFPESVELSEGDFEVRSSSPFQCRPGHELPPTMTHSGRKYQQSFICFVDYAIQGFAAMPGIDVKLPEMAELSIRYSPQASIREPALSSSQEQGHVCIVQNKHLLPEQERPRGLKENARAFFNSEVYPKFQFKTHVLVPHCVNIGQAPRIHLRLEHTVPSSEITDLSRVEVVKCRIRIYAYTFVRSERERSRLRLAEHDTQSVDTIYDYAVAGNLRNTSFCKENDWKLMVTGGALPQLIIPSFSTYCIARTYDLDVEVVVLCAKVELKLREKRVIEVLPWATSAQYPTASSSLPLIPAYEETEQLPSYARAEETQLLATSPLNPPSTVDEATPSVSATGSDPFASWAAVQAPEDLGLVRQERDI